MTTLDEKERAMKYLLLIRDGGAPTPGSSEARVGHSAEELQAVDAGYQAVTLEKALGAYLLFEADDLDTAIELASRIPAARVGGAVEVRPVVQS
jgi:hypothetical protein